MGVCGSSMPREPCSCACDASPAAKKLRGLVRKARSNSAPPAVKVVYAADFVRPRPILKTKSESSLLSRSKSTDALSHSRSLPTMLKTLSGEKGDALISGLPEMLKTLSGGSRSSREPEPEALALIDAEGESSPSSDALVGERAEDQQAPVTRRRSRRRVTFGGSKCRHYDVSKPGLLPEGEPSQGAKRRRGQRQRTSTF